MGGTFIAYMERFTGTDVDVAAGIAAHALRRWGKPENRAWFAGCMRIVAEMIEDNVEAKIPLLELPRTTVRRLKDRRVT